MHFINAKGILSAQNGMNLYRGCIYCDNRSRCYGFSHEFENIEVKQNWDINIFTVYRKARTRLEKDFLPKRIKNLPKASKTEASGNFFIYIVN